MEKSKKTIRKSTSLILLILVTLLLLSSATTVSYLVREKRKDNIFSMGNVRLFLTEDSFPQNESDRTMVPKSIVPKNPKVVNIGTEDEYAFIKVTVPLCRVSIVDETTNEIDASGRIYREIFNLISDDSQRLDIPNQQFGFSDTGSITNDHNWIFIKSYEDGNTHTHSYLFGYSSMLPGNSNAVTTTLFDKLQLRNILEGELSPDEPQTVTVSAYGIQAEELLNHITVADNNNLSYDELTAIFALYENQYQ